MRIVARTLLALGLCLLTAWRLCTPSTARASTEEFANFDVENEEEDDESLLDHLLTQTPRNWRDEWDRAPMALRTGQGCLTSGQWFLDNDLKLTTPLGRRARFGLDLRQSESDETAYDNLDLSFRFPTRLGTVGAMFRPLHDKARQDFAVMWEAGSDTTAWVLQGIFTFEDLFNNLWAFRQTRVGNASEPYERHPWEPALRAGVRRERWRGEVSGKFLTGSRKRVSGLAPGVADSRQTLWGTLAMATLEAQAFGITWEADASNRQTTSTDQPLDLSAGDARFFRRQWRGELAARRRVQRRLTAELRGVYAARTASHGTPEPVGRFDALDRALQLETVWSATPTLGVRLGGLYDQISVFQAGQPARFTYGSRHESRAYVGLTAKFGRVSVSGVEGIELDPEPYDVWLVHDKGFLHLQATF
jgi:hypothetical protein